MDISCLCRGHHLLHGGPLLAVGNILENRPLKYPGILEHHSVGSPQALPGVVPNIATLHQHSAAVHVIEAHEQVDDGGLAGSGGAYDGHHLPCPRLQVQVMDNSASLVIAEVHMLQGHIALHLRQFPSRLPIRQLLFLIQQAEYPLCRRQGGVELIGDVGDLVDRP